MPINKRESLIFTIIMCGFMVFFMSLYNFSLHMGLSLETIRQAWLGFPLAFVVGFACDWFIVAKVAKKIAFSLTRNQPRQIVIILCVSSMMVGGMVILMSLFGAVVMNGLSLSTPAEWLANIGRNVIVALPLQLLIAGPLVRSLFRSIFPVGVIVR